jgi:hypothetical protein
MSERHQYVDDDDVTESDDAGGYIDDADCLYTTAADSYVVSSNASSVKNGTPSTSNRYEDGIDDVSRPPKQSASRLALGSSRNWNTEFQLLLERPSRTPEDAKERIELIDNLIANFTLAATPIAKIIIAEEDLKIKEKTIPPANVGAYTPYSNLILLN